MERKPSESLADVKRLQASSAVEAFRPVTWKAASALPIGVFVCLLLMALGSPVVGYVGLLVLLALGPLALRGRNRATATRRETIRRALVSLVAQGIIGGSIALYIAFGLHHSLIRGVSGAAVLCLIAGATYALTRNRRLEWVYYERTLDHP